MPRKKTEGELPEEVLAVLRVSRQDFLEVVFLAANGYGSGSSKLISFCRETQIPA